MGRGGTQHRQGRLVIFHLIYQRDKKPINKWTTTHLLTCIQNEAAETGPHLHGCQVGEIDIFADAERFHLRVGISERLQEVGVRVKGHQCVYVQVREDVYHGPNLM